MTHCQGNFIGMPSVTESRDKKNHLSVDILIFLISLHSEGEISDTPESYKGKLWSEQEVFRA